MPEHNHLNNNNTEIADPQFGICFDIDGVIAKGATLIPAAKDAFNLIADENGKMIYPAIFVTNGLAQSSKKAKWLSEILGAEIRTDQVMTAPSPLSVFHSFHRKRVLVVGQDRADLIAEELGFTNLVEIDEVKEAFPLLDVVDHDNRVFLDKNPKVIAQAASNAPEFQPVEAVMIMGEPKRWETALQIIVDLLQTGGDPRNPVNDPEEPHIPLLACNMDLVFKAQSHIPRFGNGAFLACLEILYKRITGSKLQYTAIIGKPCEITMRYAEHCLDQQREKIGLKPIRRIYFIGDNPNVDIAAANWYHDFLKFARGRRSRSVSDDQEKDVPDSQDCVPASRLIPKEATFATLTAERCEGILVKTGVYQETEDGPTSTLTLFRSPPGCEAADARAMGWVVRCASGRVKRESKSDPYTGTEPPLTADDVLRAVEYILEKERTMIPEPIMEEDDDLDLENVQLDDSEDVFG